MRLGIDFGTTHTVVAAATDGRYPVAAFDTGHGFSPFVPGLAAVAFGGVGLLGAGDDVPLSSWLVWFVGSALLHDLVIAPVVVAVLGCGRRPDSTVRRAPDLE